MDTKCRLPLWVNLTFLCVPAQAHIYEDNLGGQISLLGPLVCFAIFIAICACFCRECRRREAMLATAVPQPLDPLHMTMPQMTGGPFCGPTVAGARPPPVMPTVLQPPPPGFMSYPYSGAPQDPPPPYNSSEYK